MSGQAWIPSDLLKEECCLAFCALDAALDSAALILAQLVQSGKSTRGQFRNHLTQLLLPDPSDHIAKEVKGKLSGRQLALLADLTLVRRPAICIGDDLSELEFKEDEDFDGNNNMAIDQETGPIMGRLNIVFQGHIHTAMTKTLVWEQSANSPALCIAAELGMDTLLNLLGSSKSANVDKAVLASSIKDAIHLHVDQVDVRLLALTNAWAELEDPPVRYSDDLVAGQVLSAMLVLDIRLHDGERYTIGMEQPLLVRLYGVELLGPGGSTCHCPLVSTYRSLHDRSLWVVSSYQAPESGRNMWYDPECKMSKQHGDIVINKIIDDVLVNGIGFSRRALALIFGSPSHSLRDFLFAIVCQARPDLSTESSVRTTISTILPPVPTHPRQRGPLRSGPWERFIDTTALERSIYLMSRICGVSPLEVVTCISSRGTSVGPTQMDVGHWTSSTRNTPVDRKLTFILAMFEIFAARTDPWQVTTGGNAPAHRSPTKKLVIDNISSVYISSALSHPPVAGSSAKPMVKLDNPFNLDKIRDILNSLASSKLAHHGIGRDDWMTWSILIDGKSRHSMKAADLAVFREELQKAWVSTFPGFDLPFERSWVARMKIAVGMLCREEAVWEEGGDTSLTFESLSRLAVTFMLLKRTPGDPEIFRRWTTWELEKLHTIVPFFPFAELAHHLLRHGSSIQVVHDVIIDDMAEAGVTFRELLESQYDGSEVDEIMKYRDSLPEADQ